MSVLHCKAIVIVCLKRKYKFAIFSNCIFLFTLGICSCSILNTAKGYEIGRTTFIETFHNAKELKPYEMNDTFTGSAEEITTHGVGASVTKSEIGALQVNKFFKTNPVF